MRHPILANPLLTSGATNTSSTGGQKISSPLAGEDKGEGYSGIVVKPLPVQLTNGKKVNLWIVKIPLDPCREPSAGDSRRYNGGGIKMHPAPILPQERFVICGVKV